MISWLMLSLMIGTFSAARAERHYDTSLWFYTGTEHNATIYDLDHAADILRHGQYKHDWPIVIYIHGWHESPGEKSVKEVLSAYLKRGGYNTILFNWESVASLFYTDAVMDIRILGNKMSHVILSMIQAGLQYHHLHLVGHSLGAQMCGHIGRNIIAKTNRQIILPRITGLDPAGPLFYPPLFSDHLVATDAKMVDIIHTDAGLLGAIMPTGSIDFWPNSGQRFQPGCTRELLTVPLSEQDRCSHSMSWRLWAESVAPSDQNTFLAARAESWTQFTVGNIDADRLVPMGINCPKGVTGNFYLQTNYRPPYSRGTYGIIYADRSGWL